MGLEAANKIAAGPENQVYALAYPYDRNEGGYRLYRWVGGNRWQSISGKFANEVAVG
jgi:hypothetical protein